MNSGLFSEIKNHPWVLAAVILIHIGLIVLLSINLSDDDKPPTPAAQKHNIIDAVAIDAKKYDEREKQKKLAAKKIIEDKRQQELEKKKALEKKRLAEKKAAEQKRQQALEKKKAQEKEKQLAMAKKKEQDRLAKEKLATEKRAAEKKAAEKRAAEKRAAEKKAAEKREKERLEKERRAEEKRKAEEERQRRAEEKAEFERALLEEERRREEAQRQAERAARLQTQRSQYVMLITQQVENNWLRPVSNTAGQSCEVRVTQAPSGDVIDVQLQSCTSDKAFQRSVESAVYKASPLPLPPDPELFERQIYFTFKPR